MNTILGIVFIFLLAKHCQQTPLMETTELDEEFLETTTQVPIIEKSKDEIISELQTKLSNLRRHVAAFKSKSQADAAKVQSLTELNEAYETQIDLNAATIEKLEANVKNLNASINSYKGVFLEKELEITDLQIQTRNDATNLKDYKKQISTYEEQLKTTQASSCVAFGNSTAIHLLYLPGGEPFHVPCESRSKHGLGWTVIQRRLDGSVDFYRNWNEYREGFGDLSGEFFIGLDKLHRMTSSERHELLVHFYTQNSEDDSIRYDNFLIGNETEKYMLKSLGDSFDTYYDRHNFMVDIVGMKFTTYDQDNDNFYWQNCAKECHGAWWFDSCDGCSRLSHLNGLIGKGGSGISILYSNTYIEPKYVEMMIRPWNRSH